MLNNFRQSLLVSDFDKARAVAANLEATSPRLSEFLQALVDLEERGEANIRDLKPIKMVQLEGMRQAVSAYNDLHGGLKTAPYTAKFILSKPVIFTRADLRTSPALMSLALLAGAELGSPWMMSKSLAYLQQAQAEQKLAPSALTQFCKNFAGLFEVKDRGLLLAGIEFLARLPNRFTVQAWTPIQAALKLQTQTPDLSLARKVTDGLRWVVEQPNLSSEAMTRLAFVLTKPFPLSQLTKDFLDALRDRPDLPVKARFWLFRSIIASTADKGEDRDHAPWWALVRELEADMLPNLAYALPFVGVSGEAEQAALAEIDTRIAAALEPYKPVTRKDRTAPRVKVAFVSQFFSNHGVGHVLHQTLPHLADFGVDYALLTTSVQEQAESPYLSAIEDSATEIFHTPQPFMFPRNGSVQKAAAQVESVRADVLIDLDGFMTGAAIPIAYSRPAPLNVYWIGHGGKLGLRFYDYVITDPFVGDDGLERQSGEFKLTLPTSFATSGTFDFDRSARKEDFGLPSDSVVICCFNNHDKISADYLDCLAEVAKHNDKVHLWFNKKDLVDSVTVISQYLLDAGLSEDRFSFAGRVEPKDLHYTRLHVADFAMDTFYVNMASGALDNIWAECPVLTVPGKTYHSRICGSFNDVIGLQQFNAQDRAAYVETAKLLIDEPERLQEARAIIRANKASSSLFSGRRFAEELASGLKLIVERQRAGLPPQDLVVGQDRGNDGGKDGGQADA